MVYSYTLVKQEVYVRTRIKHVHMHMHTHIQQTCIHTYRHNIHRAIFQVLSAFVCFNLSPYPHQNLLNNYTSSCMYSNMNEITLKLYFQLLYYNNFYFQCMLLNILIQKFHILSFVNFNILIRINRLSTMYSKFRMFY